MTGASRRAGIGYATARRLAALGASLFLHHYWEITSPEFHGIVYTQAIALDKLAALPACEIRAVTLWQTRRPDHTVTYHEVTGADYERAAERSLTSDRWSSYTHTR